MLIREADQAPPAPRLRLRPRLLAQLALQHAANGCRTLIIIAGGLLCVAGGLAVMVAWLVRATAVLQFGSQNPMSFNTALAFVVTGAALVALAGGHPRAALAAGLFDVVLGAVVLAEYAFGRGLGIDQLVVKAYVTGAHDVPGRMAVNTAVCLTLLGAGLLAWGPWRRRRRPAALAAAASLIAAVAVQATFGYATGNPSAYGWTHVTPMAFLTAVTMLILALSLLSAAWRDSRARSGGPAQVAPDASRCAGSRPGCLAGHRWPGRGRGAYLPGHLHRGRQRRRADHGRPGGAGGLAGAAGGPAAPGGGDRCGAAQRGRGTSRGPVSTGCSSSWMSCPSRCSSRCRTASPTTPTTRPSACWGRGVAPGIGAGELAETYGAFLAGTDQPYPAERCHCPRRSRPAVTR